MSSSFRVCKKSFQIKYLPECTLSDFKNEIDAMAKTEKKGKGWKFRVGLSVDAEAVQAGQNPLLGTITCESEEIKRAMMGYASTWKMTVGNWKQVHITDNFDGLTILHSPIGTGTKLYQVPAANICVVHGLNGNSMDTFAYDTKSKKPHIPIIWPRDLLPHRTGFRNTRVMTYDYNGDLMDPRANSSLVEWSNNFLDALGRLSKADQVLAGLSVPLLILGYSLGGLVVRDALAHLLLYPENHPYITKVQCGVIFLGTPHRGSSLADWKGIAKGFGGRFPNMRFNIVKVLETFNNTLSYHSHCAWEIKRGSYLPFACFCEENDTATGPICKKRIVKETSAGFLGQTATMLSGTDHRSICKFESQANGSLAAIDTKMLEIIGRIRENNPTWNVENSSTPHQTSPGNHSHISPQAPIRQPILYGCNEGRGSEGFFGREEEIKLLETWIEKDLEDSAKPILITGIGGIGKTELACQFARKCAEISKAETGRHVIFLSAATLDADYEALATIIGSEFFPPQKIDVREDNWMLNSHQEKGQLFKIWLERSAIPKVLIIDDADAVDRRAIEGLIQPQKARTPILLTRNPNFLSSHQPRILPLGTLKAAEAARLFNSRGTICLDDELEVLGSYLENHPLGIQNAIEAISTEIIQMPFETCSPAKKISSLFSSPDHLSRRRFLETDYFQKGSILDSFRRSVERLPRENRELLLSLLRFAGFLKSKSLDHDILHFLGSISLWPQWQEKRVELEDLELLSLATTDRGRLQLGVYIKDLVDVSLLTISGPKRNVHGLWAECIRQLVSDEDRIRFVRQIILICDTILTESPGNEKCGVRTTFLPYILECENVMKSFAISFDLVRPLHYPGNLSWKSYVGFWTNP